MFLIKKSLLVIFALICFEVIYAGAQNTVKLYYNSQRQEISFTLKGALHKVPAHDYSFLRWISVVEKDEFKQGYLVNNQYIIFSALLNHDRDILYIYEIKTKQLYALYNVTQWVANEKVGWAAVITAPFYSKMFEETPSYILIVNGKKILESPQPLTELAYNEVGELKLKLEKNYPLTLGNLSLIKLKNYFPAPRKHGEKINLFGLNCVQRKDKSLKKI